MFLGAIWMPLHICSSSQGDLKEFLIEIKMSSRRPFQLISHREKIIWHYLRGLRCSFWFQLETFLGHPVSRKQNVLQYATILSCQRDYAPRSRDSRRKWPAPCSLQDIKDHVQCLRTKPRAQDREHMTVDWISKNVTNFWSRAQWDARAPCHDQIGFHLVRALLCDLHETWILMTTKQ